MSRAATARAAIGGVARARGAALRAVGLLIILFFVAASAPPARADPGAIALLDRDSLDQRLEELTLSTPALADTTKVRVLLPEDYDPDARKRYPVLYLLHGGAGSYVDWTTVGSAREATAGRDVIVVMPDGGMGGWYTDWYAPAIDGEQPRWETYHIDQLIPWIDGHYATKGRRSQRAIAGLSMGGFGALSYAARHPDLFVAASTWSGAVNTNNPPLLAGHTIDLITGLDGGLPGSPFGLRELEEIQWRGHNPWDLAENLRGMTLSIRTGNGLPGGPFPGGFPIDALEVAVHPMGVDLHDRLAGFGIAHTFEDYGPGAHTYDYWNRDLAEDLPLIMDTFAARVPAPRESSYRTIDAGYRVFGWRVAIERQVVEFSQLKDADRRGFSLTGSGAATVRTPPFYAKRERLAVSVDGVCGEQRASRRGRLSVAVSMGPSNTLQEYAVPIVEAPRSRRTATVEIDPKRNCAP